MLSWQVVERTQSMRASARDDRIREYYYGLHTKYHPHSFEVKMSHLQIYKIGAPALPDSCMPADMKVDDHMTKLVPVEPGNLCLDPLKIILLYKFF